MSFSSAMYFLSEKGISSWKALLPLLQSVVGYKQKIIVDTLQDWTDTFFDGRNKISEDDYADDDSTVDEEEPEIPNDHESSRNQTTNNLGIGKQGTYLIDLTFFLFLTL